MGWRKQKTSMEELWGKPLFMDEEEEKPVEGEGVSYGGAAGV